MKNNMLRIAEADGILAALRSPLIDLLYERDTLREEIEAKGQRVLELEEEVQDLKDRADEEAERSEMLLDEIISDT